MRAGKRTLFGSGLLYGNLSGNPLWAKLHTESYPGYDRIRGGEAKYRRIRIFRGYLVE